MSFDYDTIRAKKHTSGTQWAAYSDLFMVLAFVFLLMYMVASLRTGMESLNTYAEIEEIKKEIETYEQIKEEYMGKSSSHEDRRMYEDVVKQLALLESEAKTEKDQLAAKYNQAKIRESSLNEYQQMLMDVLNASLIAKASAQEKIAEQNNTSKQQRRAIEKTEMDLVSLQSQLENEGLEKDSLKKDYERQTEALEKKYQMLKSRHDASKDDLAIMNELLRKEKSDKEMLASVFEDESRHLEKKYDTLKSQYNDDRNKLVSLKQELKEEASQREELNEKFDREKRKLEGNIEDLREKNQRDKRQLTQLQRKLQSEESEKRYLENTLAEKTNDLKGTIRELTRANMRSKNDLATLVDELKGEEREYDKLKDQYDSEIGNIKQQLTEYKNKDQTKQKKISSLEKALRLKENEKDAMKQSYDDAAKKLQDRLARLKRDDKDRSNELASLIDKKNNEIGALQRNLDNLNDDLRDTNQNLKKAKNDLEKQSGDLAKALQLEKNRRDIAKRIKDNFKANGINADVNSKTGDVILDFGDNYFETDSHTLKPGMKTIIRKAIPLYAQSLFGNKQSNTLISSVEIIGFASPTYGGKPVDPTALSIENRTAVNYNLDLSYRRARSIFEYVFDPDKIRFKYQDTMVHLINVTGRSFFSEKIDPKHSGGLTIDEFCGQYNCLKSQRVIIKFGLSDKGKA